MEAKQELVLTKKKVILVDAVFVLGFALLFFSTDNFHKMNLMLIFLIMGAFSTCIGMHAKYYKQTQKVY